MIPKYLLILFLLINNISVSITMGIDKILFNIQVDETNILVFNNIMPFIHFNQNNKEFYGIEYNILQTLSDKLNITLKLRLASHQEQYQQIFNQK